MKAKQAPMVRLTADGARLLDELADIVAKQGWSALHVMRQDMPTRAAIIEEALTDFMSKRHGK